MGFASHLEDLIERHDENAFFNSSPNTPRSLTKLAAREDGAFDDANEVERHYRSKLRKVHRFTNYYKQERQLLEHSRHLLPGHFNLIEKIQQALMPIESIAEWNDDDAKWTVVKGVGEYLNGLVQGQAAHVLSPKLINRLAASANDTMSRAESVLAALKRY